MSESPASGWRATWQRLSRLGVDTVADPRSRKRVIFANQVAITLALPCFPWFFILWYSGPRVLAYLMPYVIAGYFLTPALNAFGRTQASRLWLITHGNLMVLAYAMALGEATGIHMLWLSTCWVSLILFDWSERKSMVYALIISSCFLVAFQARASFGGEWHPMPADQERLMRFSSLLTAMSIQIAAVAYFFAGNRRTELALAHAGEAAQAADKAKSQFLANMSHELRTPLNGILGMSGLLLKAEMPPALRDTAGAVHSSAQDLLAIVNDVLDLSSVEAGRMRLDPAPFSLRELVRAVLMPFRIEAGRKGLTLETDLETSLPDRLLGDAIRIKQVLNNLLGNAFKFTESGHVHLRVRAGERSPAGRALLEFEIEDSGIGIPEHARSELFKAFSQADGSTTRRHEGTGLGLFITKQILDAMGGKIAFNSVPGRGTLFRFSLQLPLAQTPAPGPEAAPLPPGAAALRILIVDDQRLNADVLHGMLAGLGLRSDIVTGAEEALKACSAREYDLVLMDCHMPGMDGFDCTRKLKEGQASGGPSIIGITADARESTRKRCLEAGMEEMLTKPLLEKDLKRELERCLSRRAREIGTVPPG